MARLAHEVGELGLVVGLAWLAVERFRLDGALGQPAPQTLVCRGVGWNC
jgi:hypothetical protein